MSAVLVLGITVLRGTMPAMAAEPAPPVDPAATPAGWAITPAGTQIAVSKLPLGLAATPDEAHVLVSSNSGGLQSLNVIDTTTLTNTMTPTGNLFIGVAAASDGHVFAAGGNADRLFKFLLTGGVAAPVTFTEAVPFPSDAAVDAAGGDVLAATPGADAVNGVRVTSYPGQTLLDGDLLYVSGTLSEATGTTDTTACPSGQVACGRVTVIDKSGLSPKVLRRVPVGLDAFALALDPIRQRLYVANWADESGRGAMQGGTVSVVDVSDPANAVETSFVTVGHHPTALQLSADRETLFVANSNDDTISVVDVGGSSTPVVKATESVRPLSGVPVGAHPNALALSPDGSTLFVALAGLNAIEILDGESGARFAGTPEYIPTGWYPSALLVTGTADDYRLWVANAKGSGQLSGLNLSVGGNGDPIKGSLSVIDLPVDAAQHDAWTEDVRVNDRLDEQTVDGCSPPPGIRVSEVLCPAAAFLPGGSGVYPKQRATLARTGGESDWLVVGGLLLVAAVTMRSRRRRLGALAVVVGAAMVATMTPRPSAAGPTDELTRSPIHHVVYIVTENKTFDQYFGDLSPSDGFDADPSFLLYGDPVTPNHHALAGRYSTGDRFFSDGEVSVTGHSWTSGAVATDHNEKTWGVEYDQGLRGNRGGGDPLRPRLPGETGAAIGAAEEELQDPEGGYIFEAFKRAGAVPPGPADTPGSPLTMAIYGESTARESGDMSAYKAPHWKDGDIGYFDTCRAAQFITGNSDNVQTTSDNANCEGRTLPPEFNLAHWTQVMHDSGEDVMPNFIYMSLPVNHTLGTNPGSPTPASMVADNDYAVGLIVEALSKSPFWESTVVMQTEDDTQAAGDHVSYLRDYLQVSGPWSQPGVNHQWGSLPALLRTIETIFNVEPISLYDRLATPMHLAFRARLDEVPDTGAFTAIRPGIPFGLNTLSSAGAQESQALDFTTYDRVDEATLNAILYADARGTPYVAPDGDVSD
jgi:DNA-binding beta-propeller fold protein YncE